MVLMLRFLNVMFLSQELRIKRRDELNSRYDLADQVLVVGQEKIGTGLRGGSQVDCIRRGKAQHSANACVVIRGFNRKRDDLTNYTPQQALGFVCNLDSANMIRPARTSPNVKAPVINWSPHSSMRVRIAPTRSAYCGLFSSQ